MNEKELHALQAAQFVSCKTAHADLKVLDRLPQLILDEDPYDFTPYADPEEVETYFRSTTDQSYYLCGDGFLYGNNYRGSRQTIWRRKNVTALFTGIVASDAMQNYLLTARAGERLVPRHFALKSTAGRLHDNETFSVDLAYTLPETDQFELTIHAYRKKSKAPITFHASISRPMHGHADGRDFYENLSRLCLVDGTVSGVSALAHIGRKQLR